MKKIVFIFFVLSSCNAIDKKSESNQNATNTKFVTDYRDSLSKIVVDTSTFKGKQQFIMHTFVLDYFNSPTSDTLFDINYDGFEDYLITYYGLAGTGLKNKVQVSFYDSKRENYVLNEQLSELSNPTFYINQKKITSFYLGNGGGGGRELRWINGKWITTKEFSVDNDGDTTKWKINYPLQKKNTVITKQYQMIPPNDILETKIDF